MSYAYGTATTPVSTYPGQPYPASAHTSPHPAAAQPATIQHSVSPYHGAHQGIAPSMSPYPGAVPPGGAGVGLVPPGHAPSVSTYPGMPGAPVAGATSPYSGSTLSMGGGIGSSGSSTIVGGGSPMPGAYPGATAGMQSAIGVPPGGQLTIGPAAATAAGGSQPFAANVKPGSLTFTTSTDAQGRTIYHHFRAESASYRSPQGVTYTGIQWIPYETSYSPPPHIPPAGPDVIASFRGQLPGQTPSPGVTLHTSPPVGGPVGGSVGGPVGGAMGGVGGGIDPYAYRGGYQDDRWERDEQKRRKKEAKEAAKREAKWEAERIARERAEEKELRRARELDARREEQARMRRLSNATGPVPMPMPPAGGYSGASAYERDRERERDRELERRMGDMSLGGGGLTAEYGAGPGTRSRRQSMSMPEPGIVRPGMGPGAAGAVYDEPDDYDDGYVGAGERSRRNSSYLGGGAGGGVMPERSPYRRGTQQLEPVMGPDGMPVYPPGHILEGQPVAPGDNTLGVSAPGGMGGGVYSRSHSPVPGVSRLGPGGGAPYSSVSPRVSPRVGGGAGMPISHNRSMSSGGYGGVSEQQLLATPEAFDRPINRFQSFTPFEMAKVQDMDDFLKGVFPRLPPALATHDVLPEDWERLMNDLALAWQERLPLPRGQDGELPKRKRLVADLLELWNNAFFHPRNMELALYKGRERYSGRFAGRPEYRLPRIESSDSYTSDSDSEDLYSDDPDDGSGRRYGYGMLGYGQERYDRERIAAEQRESREYRRQRREEKKHRRREKKMRRKDRTKRYTLYMCYLPPEPGREPVYAGAARSTRSVHSGHGY